jgi:hypothetical protein
VAVFGYAPHGWLRLARWARGGDARPPRGEQDEQRLHAERGNAQGAAPVTDIAVIAKEAARQGAGQHITAHSRSGQDAGCHPHQPARPGDHHPADQDRCRDDAEIPDADQRGRAQCAGQVDDVDHRQGGQGRGT